MFIVTFLIVYVVMLIGFVVGYVTRVIDEKLKYTKIKDSPCIHGFEDWDDCPDCCH